MRIMLLLAFIPTLAHLCSDEFSYLVYDGLCSTRVYGSSKSYDDAKSTCESMDGHLPMFYSKEDFDRYQSEYWDNFVWIGLRCDGEKFVWEDGTVAAYTFFNTQDDAICNTTNVNRRYYTAEQSYGKWGAKANGSINQYYNCFGNERSWICDTYWLLQQGKGVDICYLLETKNTNFTQAEANCENQWAHISPIHDQSFNDFVKRTAIANGLMGGVHIGLKSVDGKYIWSDGSEADYLNFAPGFPDPTFGDCLAMGIGLFPGQWMNIDCATPLPYMCTKPAASYDESIPPEGCTDHGEYFPGDEIFSPTWGSATGPAYCNYALVDTEDTSKKITVEIVLFESNTCCDTLTIYDGLFGTNVLKKLSGYYGITSIVVSGTTNAIRMEWNATSGAHVRGWHARVGSV